MTPITTPLTPVAPITMPPCCPFGPTLLPVIPHCSILPLHVLPCPLLSLNTPLLALLAPIAPRPSNVPHHPCDWPLGPCHQYCPLQPLSPTISPYYSLMPFCYSFGTHFSLLFLVLSPIVLSYPIIAPSMPPCCPFNPLPQVTTSKNPEQASQIKSCCFCIQLNLNFRKHWNYEKNAVILIRTHDQYISYWNFARLKLESFERTVWFLC